MAISLFDMFKVGIGPSSSHTVGPMVAARCFALALFEAGLSGAVQRLSCELFGSLGATGQGHGSVAAVLAGLEGYEPATVDPSRVPERAARILSGAPLRLLAACGSDAIIPHAVGVSPDDLQFSPSRNLPLHTNGLRFQAWSDDGALLLEAVYYSVGGGFVLDAAGRQVAQTAAVDEWGFAVESELPWPFRSAAELLQRCRDSGMSIAGLMLANEMALRSGAANSEAGVRCGILDLWRAMQSCIDAGIEHDGLLPGGLGVKRRAPALFRDLNNRARVDMITPSLGALDWVNLYALAVNEENAAGGRVVTAPTNGAAGVIPAVLQYYRRFCPNANDDGVVDFMLTAAAIGILFKENASISGAEVGCQGEVGSACAMAAAGLAAAIGGTPEQIENAAEIGMEHNLGLTCDPVGGLVQIPCIERNAMAAIKAINAATMALHGNGEHRVSLDRVIRTMHETGRDMLDKYKETSRGGLAVNLPEC